MSFHSGHPIKATRKPQPCDWCGKRIEKGSRAYYTAGVWEGDFFTGYAHPECHHAKSHANRDDLMNGWAPGDYARGRTDDDYQAGPMFDEDGNRIDAGRPPQAEGPQCAPTGAPQEE